MHTIEVIEKLSPKLKYIKFNKKAAKEFADSITRKDLEKGKISFSTYDWSLKDHVLFLFYLNSMNYCFWARKNQKKWTTKMGGESLDGFIALYKILENRAKNDKNFLNPSYITSLSFDNVKDLLKGSPEIPLLESKYKNLITTARIIEKRFRGDIFSIIEDNNYETKNILDEIETKFPSYEDSQNYRGYEIHFLKRAQLLVKMINDELEKHNKALKNLDYLTAIADYKVPQLLRYHGITKYSDRLSNLVDDYRVLEKDSDHEIEIRIGTLWGVELIRRGLEEKFPNITNADIDNLLWVSAQSITDDIKPYHRCYTTGY
jgi:hypothetical protein